MCGHVQGTISAAIKDGNLRWDLGHLKLDNKGNVLDESVWWDDLSAHGKKCRMVPLRPANPVCGAVLKREPFPSGSVSTQPPSIVVSIRDVGVWTCGELDPSVCPLLSCLSVCLSLVSRFTLRQSRQVDMNKLLLRLSVDSKATRCDKGERGERRGYATTSQATPLTKGTDQGSQRVFLCGAKVRRKVAGSCPLVTVTFARVGRALETLIVGVFLRGASGGFRAFVLERNVVEGPGGGTKSRCQSCTVGLQ